MTEPGDSIGYAVVGLGWIAQAAMLPAFENAGNARLTALVSGDDEKRRALADRYDLPDDAVYDYDAYEDCLARDDVDAVYIALPNHLHREYTVRAARAGVHVLCEKPMAVTAAECREMIEACDSAGVKLMIAYRLHLEPANLRLIELVEEGDIGDTRVIGSTFSQQVEDGDVRLMPDDRGGGPLYDMGVYCLNAARYLFRAEPGSVMATSARRRQDRFRDATEAISCVLRFPGERLATFTCSFGAASSGALSLLGDDGDIQVENPYSFRGERVIRITRDGKQDEERFEETDQFGPQLVHLSDCILEDRQPEPSGREGLVDVAIIEALYRSIEEGRAVEIDVKAARRPEPDNAIERPAVEEPELVNADEPDE